MEIRHEAPSPETTFRLRAPLHIGFPDGQAVRVDDWSLRALYSRELIGRPLEGLMLSIPFQGVGVYFPVDLEPGEAEDEFLFRNLSGRERETLALFHRNLLSGRMTATAEMISALDTPVDLVPMGETEAERAEAEAKLPPRRARMLVNLGYYLVLFALVAGFLGTVIWNRMTVVPAQSAHVAAAASRILAPAAGFVREIPAAEGAQIAAGATLIRLDDQEGLRLLAEAETAEAEAAELLSGAEARQKAHEDQRDAARAGFRGGVERFDQGVSVNAGDYHDIRLRLEAEAERLRSDLDRLRARLGVHRERAEATALTAPGDGRVLRHFVRPFDMVRPGDPLLEFELDQPRGIIAHLPADAVLRVWPGMAAEVTHIRDGHRHRLPGHVDRLTATGAGETALITARIALTGLGLEESRALLEDGAPVHVALRSRPLARWLAWLRP